MNRFYIKENVAINLDTMDLIEPEVYREGTGLSPTIIFVKDKKVVKRVRFNKEEERDEAFRHISLLLSPIEAAGPSVEATLDKMLEGYKKEKAEKEEGPKDSKDLKKGK